MMPTLVLLAILASGGDRLLVVQTNPDLAPESSKVRVFAIELEMGVRQMSHKLCTTSPLFVLRVGGKWSDRYQSDAVYFAELSTEGNAEVILWQIPMAGVAPERAATDMIYNVGLALSAAQHCGGIIRLCPKALKGLEPCKEKR